MSVQMLEELRTCFISCISLLQKIPWRLSSAVTVAVPAFAFVHECEALTGRRHHTSLQELDEAR